MRKYFFIFAICWVIFLIHAISIKHGIYGDGGGYYVYTQALFFDKGLNFGPIYNFMQHFQGVKGEFNRLFWDTPYNPYPIGTGLIWIPAMAVTSLFFQNRFSLIYEIGPGLTGIILVIGGLYFLEKYLQNFFSKKVATASVIAIFLTSNLLYYSSFEPALSHQPAFFIIAFLLYKTYKMSASFHNYLLVGALGGLLFTIRIPDSIFLIPVIYQILENRPKFKFIIVSLISAGLFTIPLFWSYYIMTGNAFRMPYLTGDVGSFSYSFKNLYNFFFTAKRGLFTWTPVYLFAILGLIKSRKYIFILTLGLIIFVSSSWASVSVAFGQRFILAGIPYFAFGIAEIIKTVKYRYISILFIFLFFWNLLTIFQFYFNKTEVIKDDNLTLKTFIIGQFKTPIKTLGLIKDEGLNHVFYNKLLY